MRGNRVFFFKMLGEIISMYKIKIAIKLIITNICINIIRKINKHCDRILSNKLHNLAEEYNTRPGINNY